MPAALAEMPARHSSPLNQTPLFLISQFDWCEPERLKCPRPLADKSAIAESSASGPSRSPVFSIKHGWSFTCCSPTASFGSRRFDDGEDRENLEWGKNDHSAVWPTSIGVAWRKTLVRPPACFSSADFRRAGAPGAPRNPRRSIQKTVLGSSFSITKRSCTCNCCARRVRVKTSSGFCGS